MSHDYRALEAAVTLYKESFQAQQLNLKGPVYLPKKEKEGTFTLYLEMEDLLFHTYIYDENSLMIESLENCARYKLESVNSNQLVLSQQGSSEIYKYKFKRC